MASISLRELDEETMAALRQRAAQHGVSLEEELRRIIQLAVAAPQRLGDLALAYFGEDSGVELELSQYEYHDPIDLLS